VGVVSDLDRFVQFLRRVAAEYNAPPPTPRDDIWGRIETSVFAGDTAEVGEAEQGTIDGAGPSTLDEEATDNDGSASAESDRDLDRFVEFLVGAASEYNKPPATPRDDMWDGIESTLALQTPADLQIADDLDTAEDLGTVKDLRTGDDVLSAAADIYHAPPSAPRDEMWGRIEAAWQMRRSTSSATREAGLEPLPARPVPDLADPAPAGPKRDRRKALLVTGLAIAASLVIGIAIGRRSAEQLRSDSPATTVAQGGTGAVGEPGSTPSGPAGAIETQTPGELARTRDPGAQASETGSETPGGVQSETLESGPPQGARLAAMEPPPDTETGGPRDVVGDRASRRAVAIHYATAAHLGRAEALLTTFRTEPDSGNGQVSRWARELLAETRLLMDLPNRRDPLTTALLQELELVLASIAGLGDDAPSGERTFIADGLDQQGTLPRLRAVMPSGPAGAGRVGT
jgi:hypothetical protein